MAISHLTAAETERNVQSVRDVPYAILPKGKARDILESLARTGVEVYAYTHNSGATIREWYVWLGPLADTSADHNGQVTMADWIQHFDVLYTAVNVIASYTGARPGGAA